MCVCVCVKKVSLHKITFMIHVDLLCLFRYLKGNNREQCDSSGQVIMKESKKGDDPLVISQSHPNMHSISIHRRMFYASMYRTKQLIACFVDHLVHYFMIQRSHEHTCNAKVPITLANYKCNMYIYSKDYVRLVLYLYCTWGSIRFYFFILTPCLNKQCIMGWSN